MTTTQAPHPIGTPGVPWGTAEVAQWRSGQAVKRSYEADVLSVIEELRAGFDVILYGRLDYAPDTYPLFAIKSRDWRDELRCVLVTGGVHGYETSGVHGALQFLGEHASRYQGRGQSDRRALCQPLGLRKDSTLESRRSRSEPLVPRVQSRAGICGPHAPR